MPSDQRPAPRLRLAQLPTPIQRLERLSAAYGKDLYVKRDDMTGTEVSGNKVRKLEYALADALQRGCDCVITVGAAQSNHCRATAACCARLGLPCYLLLRGARQAAEGNLFLDRMLGARIRLLPPDADLQLALDAAVAQLRGQGKKPYAIPLGASDPVGSLGYVAGYEELLAQEAALPAPFDAVCLAVGSGGTYAGLWLANQREGRPKRIRGYAVSNSVAHFERAIVGILQGMDSSLPAAPTLDLSDRSVGLGYGLATREEVAQYADIARLEGLVLDPCYTGKAFLGMLQDIRDGVFDGQQRILFLHTGGLMGWTAAQRALAPEQAEEW